MTTNGPLRSFHRSPMWRSSLAALGVAGLVTAAFFVGRARAAGIPETETLRYSGTLLGADGAPLVGNHNIEVRLWTRATGGTSADCTTNGDEFSIDAGRFSVPLPDTCLQVVEDNPELWVEVVVDGASLGRAKAGAVPFAVAAKHAVAADSANSATTAAPGGSLAARLTALENTKVTSVGAKGPLRMCSGSTPMGDTAWRPYDATTVAVTIDISTCGFSARPNIVSSLVGTTSHWLTTGGSSPYTPEGAAAATEFDIYVYSAGGITPAVANTQNWHISWIAVGN